MIEPIGRVRKPIAKTGQSIDDRTKLNLAVRRGTASHGRSGTVLNALAAIDIALWDIAGKAAKQSISAMLGGAKRARLPVMASLDKYNDKAKVRGSSRRWPRACRR